LLVLVGDADLNMLGLDDRLRCQQCSQHPSRAWVTYAWKRKFE
jgi:hypothetical protein